MPLAAVGRLRRAATSTAAGELKVHDHLFPCANTAIPHLLGLRATEVDRGPPRVQRGRDARRPLRRREGGAIDGELHRAAAARGAGARARARRYLLETVIRTVKMGHLFTQGTADSNEVWLDVDRRRAATA